MPRALPIIERVSGRCGGWLVRQAVRIAPSRQEVKPGRAGHRINPPLDLNLETSENRVPRLGGIPNDKRGGFFWGAGVKPVSFYRRLLAEPPKEDSSGDFSVPLHL